MNHIEESKVITSPMIKVSFLQEFYISFNGVQIPHFYIMFLSLWTQNLSEVERGEELGDSWREERKIVIKLHQFFKCMYEVFEFSGEGDSKQVFEHHSTPSQNFIKIKGGVL